MRPGDASYEMDEAAAARFGAYFEQVGTCLRDKRKRESFALVVFGSLGKGERKRGQQRRGVRAH